MTDNADWITHVFNLKSTVNLGTLTTVEAIKDSAKSYINDLKHAGCWKKDSAKNPTSFATSNEDNGESCRNGNSNSNSQNGRSSWKYDRSLSTTTTLKHNNNTYQWCTGPGHKNRPMWVVHQPGTCTPMVQGSTRGTANNAEASSNAKLANTAQNQCKQCTNISKTKFNKELHALFADNELEPTKMAQKISKLAFKN